MLGTCTTSRSVLPRAKETGAVTHKLPRWLAITPPLWLAFNVGQAHPSSHIPQAERWRKILAFMGMLANEPPNRLRDCGVALTVSAAPSPFLPRSPLPQAPAYPLLSPPKCKARFCPSLGLTFQLLSKRHLLHQHPTSGAGAALERGHFCCWGLSALRMKGRVLQNTERKASSAGLLLLLKEGLHLTDLCIPLLQRRWGEPGSPAAGWRSYFWSNSYHFSNSRI